MTAPRKSFQVEVLPHPEGMVVVHRLDNGSVWYSIVDFHANYNGSPTRAPDPLPVWIEIPPPPGVTPFTGSNGAPDDGDEPSKRRRSF